MNPASAEGSFGKRQGHDLKRVTRSLATGERRTYLYYRPTMTRLRNEPGSDGFESELAELRRGRTRPAAGVEYVYFVHAPDNDAVKIGRAADPNRRVQILQVGSPGTVTLLGWIRTTPEDRLESVIQGRFKKDRLRGEWFRATPELMKFIRDRARA
jgi:hypothetical protein